jgi:hypothetical protein
MSVSSDRGRQPPVGVSPGKVHNRVVAGRHRKPPYGHGRHRKQMQPGRWASPVLAGLIVLGISGVGAVTAITDHGSGAPTTGSAATSSSTAARTTYLSQAQKPTPTSPSPTPRRTHATQPTRARTSATKPASPRRFELTVIGHVVWVSVTIPGRRTLFAGMLRHGRTLRYDAHPLDVVIGDAGAVRLVLQGHAHSPAGKSGEVLRLTVR